MSTLTLTIDITPEGATLRDAAQPTTGAAVAAPSPMPLEDLGVKDLGVEDLGNATHDPAEDQTMTFEPLPLEDLDALAGTAQPADAIGAATDAATSATTLELTDAPRPEDDF